MDHEHMDMDFSPPFPGLPASPSASESEEEFPFRIAPPERASAEDENELSQSTFKGEWEKVVELYETKPGVHYSVITSSNDTALHMAISDEREDVVKKMVESIVHNNNKEALEMKNNKGETLLHRAATRKSVTMCKYIVEAGQSMGLHLLGITNKWGETPIFLAALHNRKPAFTFLHNAAEKAYPLDKDKPYQFLRRTAAAGDTVLHAAIEREHVDLAFHIIKMCPHLMGKSNEKGTTPLHVLASKPSVFRSGLSLSWWKQIIFYCIYVDLLKYDPKGALTLTTSYKTAEQKCPAPANYLTCYQFLRGCCVVLGRIKDYRRGRGKSSGSGREGVKKEGGDPEAQNNSNVNKNIPQNYTTCYEALVSVCVNLFCFMGFEKIFNKIKEGKEKHVRGVQILKALMEKHNLAYITEGTDPGKTRRVLDPRAKQTPPMNAQAHQKGNGGDKGKKTSIGDDEKEETYTPLLVAAQNGVMEVVNEILTQLPVSIYESTSRDKNILQVAVENRQPKVIEAVKKQVEKELKLNLWGDLTETLDDDNNTILHLAAKYEKSRIHQIHGTVMQMQWEITWYEYVKSLLPHHFPYFNNTNGQTPEQIFKEHHGCLVEKSGEWLKDTSQSCSVVAALVAGVSFATSSQVPGGTKGETGKPTLEGQPEFELFAITALIGLCFSVTALIMFLSILTSRKLPRDFKRDLPVKILLGLSSLFVSIASMLISFCAAHFFVLEDRFKTAVFPLYAATCLPVSFYAIVQFPLYVDLLKSIVTKAPQSLPSGHV